MSADFEIRAEGVRREMLMGRSEGEALSHASMIIANQREHLQRCGHAAEEKDIRILELQHRLAAVGA